MTHCKYHPLSQANYFCEQCDTHYCDVCSDESPQAINKHNPRLCVRCDNELNELDHKRAINPFWRELSNVYTYPLTISSITILCVIALISSIVPYSLLLLLLSLIILSNYCVICLDETANGKMNPPSIDNLLSVNLTILFKIIALFFLMGGATRLSSNILGNDFAVLVALFFTITLPAAIITLVIDKKLLNAIDPVKLVSVVKNTGISYFFLCLFLIIMLSSLGVANEFLISKNPSFINFFATSLMSAYYAVIIFHLMGYVVYQNHERLGFPVKIDVQAPTLRPERKRQNDHVDTLIKAGDYEKATTLSSKLLTAEASLWEWKRCFNLNLISADIIKLTAFLDKYFVILNEHKQVDLMAECYLKAHKRNSNYLPKNTQFQLDISKVLIEIGHYKNTILLLKNFHENSPDKKQIRQAYMLLSKSFSNLDGYEKQATNYAMKAAKMHP